MLSGEERINTAITEAMAGATREPVQGHTDTSIADRLGPNVRTARLHIAKLAAHRE
ncbi:hypothetical protein [Streptomyces caniscabiei]|uniref:hypothetical protein n=1 Tax=Streptomyces caniscabiei TaxID=2746961 RepID=UPI0038D4DEF1